jgi:hypothetical protein
MANFIIKSISKTIWIIFSNSISKNIKNIKMPDISSLNKLLALIELN